MGIEIEKVIRYVVGTVPKTTGGRKPAHQSELLADRTIKRGSGHMKVTRRDVKGVGGTGGNAQFEAVMRAAEQSGLLGGKHARIGGRVSPELVRQAKRQTGIEADTDLIAFALATVALEDNFAETFTESRGKVEPDIKLGF